MKPEQNDDESGESQLPLTLQHIEKAIHKQGKTTEEKLNQHNAKEICSYIRELDLEFQGKGLLNESLTNEDKKYTAIFKAKF